MSKCKMNWKFLFRNDTLQCITCKNIFSIIFINDLGRIVKIMAKKFSTVQVFTMPYYLYNVFSCFYTEQIIVWHLFALNRLKRANWYSTRWNVLMKISWLVTNLSINLGYSASHMPGGGVLFKFKAINFLNNKNKIKQQ